MDSNIIFDDIYKMTSIPRGFCVIINMVNFNGNDEQGRSDSVKSVSLINQRFEELKFKVIIYQDSSDVQIKNLLKELINKEECNLHNCFVLYIHSHGKENGFITANNKIVQFDEITKMFSNKNCKNFINKPKIILFDCCRTGKNVLILIYLIKSFIM